MATLQGSSEASFLRIRNITRIISEAVNRAQQLPVAITLRSYPHPHFDEQREVNWHILPDVQQAREPPPPPPPIVSMASTGVNVRLPPFLLALSDCGAHSSSHQLSVPKSLGRYGLSLATMDNGTSMR